MSRYFRPRPPPITDLKPAKILTDNDIINLSESIKLSIQKFREDYLLHGLKEKMKNDKMIEDRNMFDLVETKEMCSMWKRVITDEKLTHADWLVAESIVSNTLKIEWGDDAVALFDYDARQVKCTKADLIYIDI